MSRLFAFAVRVLLAVLALHIASGARAEVPLFDYLTGTTPASMVGFTPSALDPRDPANHQRLPTASLRADLEALRPAFDGLILYGYHEASTPRVVALARDLKFRAVLLAVWDPRSADEVDGVAKLARQFHDELAIGIVVGNEGITFKRYEADDVRHAADRLRSQLPESIPLTTSEPLSGYESEFVRHFGDFLAPNIHPVFDRPDFGPAEAAEWARREALKLAEESGKPVLLKETGFPHGGRETFTPESQRAFWSAYLKPGRLAHAVDRPAIWVFYGVGFESFDLPWKARASQLPIEEHWGLLSPQREPYPAFDEWRSLSATASDR